MDYASLLVRNGSRSLQGLEELPIGDTLEKSQINNQYEPGSSTCHLLLISFLHFLPLYPTEKKGNSWKPIHPFFTTSIQTHWCS